MLWPAFILGLAGSLHCIGMCGPLALALPGSGGGFFRLVFGRVAYSAGRVSTYAALGALAGFIGQGLLIAGYQRSLSLAAGLAMLIWLVLSRSSSSASWFGRLLARIMLPLKTAIARQLSDNSMGTLFAIGLLNGLLPCGLVYLALATAVTAGSARGGALAMMAFGLGTVPAMLAMALFGGRIRWRLRQSLQRATPLIVFGLAVLLVLRGLSLGIPYVSPILPAVGVAVGDSCCGR